MQLLKEIYSVSYHCLCESITNTITLCARILVSSHNNYHKGLYFGISAEKVMLMAE